MNGAAIAMPSSSIGMSIRLNFGWWYDMSLIPLCGARCFVFKSDVVTNYTEESDSDHTRERFRPRTSSSGHRYWAIMSGLGICGRKSDHSIPTAFGCQSELNQVKSGHDG
jgi:hypothetical protein